MTSPSRDIDDHLADLVDGDRETLERLGPIIAQDDALRDAKHDAERIAADVARAGDDAPDADFAARVLAAIDADEATAATHLAMPQAEAGSPAPARRLLWLGVPLAAAAAGVAYVARGGDVPIAGSSAEAKDALATVTRKVGDGLEHDGRRWITDRRTRAELALADGSTAILAPGSEIETEGARAISLRTGAAIFEVEKNDTPFTVAVPGGKVEVLGTRFAVSEDEGEVSVQVLRGKVKVSGEGDSFGVVEPGQEALLRNGKVEVIPSFGISDTLSWAELEPEVDTTAGSSLGELRAKKPGDRSDDRPLTLARHQVQVRVVGNVARTEIEQSFRNDTGDTLEGIYSFPLPVDAQIESLALDVEGGFEEGAFVDRQRAAKIWAGVIHNATPVEQRKPAVEMIWVPGPWRDPALLEWQKGGSFDLRIFPIPARGQRTIRLAYTQTLAPVGKRRRYVYPMAHSSDGSTAAERIDVDVRVAGAAAQSVRAHGYSMERSESERSVSLRFGADRFSPAGDLIVDFALESEHALSYWSYVGEAAAAPSEAAAAPLDRAARRLKSAAGSGAATDPQVVAAQTALAADPRGYVLFALRPQLPAWTEHQPRDIAIVVDSSQSMVGERYQRATQVVREIVQELDRRDRVAVFACDLGCRPITEGFQRPSMPTAENAAATLRSLRPAGSSDPSAALVDVASRLGTSDRPREILYIGDGIASVGHRQAATTATQVRELRARTRVSVSTLGIGSDSDSRALAAMAQAGGGHHRAFVPGESASRVAMAVLESTYGPRLTETRLSLPPGLEDVVPSTLPNVHAGEEILVAARMSQPVSGELALSGSVAGKPFRQTFPVKVEAVTAAGNAFVPRTWAALRVAELEGRGRAEDRSNIVALSKAYAVMSRHTSLLVLESESMFSAFGIDRAKPQVSWSGDDEAVVTEVGDLGASDDAAAMTTGSGVLGGFDGAGRGGVRGATAAPMRAAEASKPKADKKAEAEDAFAADRFDLDALQEEKRSTATRSPLPRSRRGPGRWIRRVRVTTASLATRIPDRSAAVESARAELSANPDRREAHRALVRALSAAGELDEAERAAEAWLLRDQLDAEALTYLADAMGRQGRRAESLRILSGVVDLDPDRVVLHERMIAAYRRAGMSAEACAHEVALAEAGEADADRVGAGVRCLRVLGRASAAESVLDAAASAQKRVQAEAAASRPAAAERVRGPLLATGRWTAAEDLDLSIITPEGTRLSWMGGRTRVIAGDARSLTTETLGLTAATPGLYVVEVNRTDDSRTPISGTVELRAYGRRQTVSFTLEGERQLLATIQVRREWRMEEE